MRTNFPTENGESDAAPKLFPNISGHLGSENECNVKFPKRLRHNGKGRVLATIYKRQKGYRLYWRTRVVVEQRTHHQTTGEPMKFLSIADWTALSKQSCSRKRTKLMGCRLCATQSWKLKREWNHLKMGEDSHCAF